MTTSKHFLSPLLVFCTLFAASSCSSNGADEAETSFQSIANFVMEPYTGNDDQDSTAEVTRTALHYNITKHYIYSYWDKTNDIGVFPINPKNSQIRFTFVSQGENVQTSKVLFKGQGWVLQPGGTYVAYYPWKDLLGSTTYDAIPMVFSNQVQTGNNNMDHIGASYDFMHASSVTAKDSTVTFNFNHINGLYKVELYPPVAATWTSLTLTNFDGDRIFCDSAMLNVATGDIIRLRDTCSVTLKLNDVVTKTDHDTITLYISTVPIEASGRMVVELRDNDGLSYYDITKNTWMKKGQFSTLHKRPLLANRLYVDLGLPSGNLWSVSNLGATLPWEHGYYYGWGMVYPLDRYYWDYYLYSYDEQGNGGTSMSDLYKYTINDGFTDGAWYKDGVFQGDNKKTLDLSIDPITVQGVTLTSDDAARYYWEGKWQMPTAADFNELLTYCTYSWEKNYKDSGVNGYLFTGRNGNTMFLPASGWVGTDNSRDETRVKCWQDEFHFWHQQEGYQYNKCGYYWTNELSDEYSFDAKELNFSTATDWRDSTVVYAPVVTTAKRYIGGTIRPVMHK